MANATTRVLTSTASRPYLLVLLALIVIEAAGIFEQTMVMGAVPFFAKHFELDLLQASWIITTFVLVGAASAVVAGRLGDAYGRRKVIVVLLIISILGSLISVAFGSYPAILVARALQGTSAGIVPLLIGLARENMDPKRVPVAVAIVTATASFTGGVGIWVGGLFIDAGAWRTMFAVAAGFALFALLLTIVVLPRNGLTTGERRLDWFGAIVLAPALALLLYGVSNIRNLGWGSPVLWGTMGGGVVLLAVWTWWELRAHTPIINLRYLVKPEVTRAMLAAMIAGVAGLSLPPIALSVYFQAPTTTDLGLGASASTYGLIYFIGSLVGFVISPLIGRLARRFGASWVLMGGAMLQLVSALALMVPALRAQMPIAVTATILISVGVMFLLAAVYNLIVNVVPAESTSEFVGVAQVLRNIMIAVGTVVVGAILASSVMPGTAVPTIDAWNGLMTYFAVVSAVLVILGLFIRRDDRVPLLAAEPGNAGRLATGAAPAADRPASRG